MSWQTGTLGQVLTLKRGYDLPDSHRSYGDVPIVSSSGITGYHSESKAKAPGVVTGRYGTIGEVFYLDEDYWPLNTALYVADFKGNHPRFVSYFLRNVLSDYQSDKAAVPGVNRNVLHALKVEYPVGKQQERIADTLSAYDNLIDNNRRRMALLEEAARQLYREWFVRLRFPGHEHTRITDGVPEGWQWAPLEQLCAEGDGIQTGPFGSQLHQSDYTDDGVPVVMPKDLVALRISEDSIAHVPEALAEQLGRHRMRPGDTVYGRRGDIGRRAFIRRKQTGWLCGTGCLRIRPDAVKVNERYLFDTVGSPQTAATIANRAKGSTMPNLSAGAVKSVPILLAPRMLQDMYSLQVEAFFDLLETLSEQNGKLRAARDLLLPRLMSGEIAV